MLRTIAVLLLLSSVAHGGPAYDKTANVFISRSTADGYHVGDSVCYSTNHAVDCYPDGPRVDYRFEFPNGEFATVRFIAGSHDDEDALALIFERKDKDTTVRYRWFEKVTDTSKAYTIGVSYSVNEHGRTVEKEARYRVYPDAKSKIGVEERSRRWE
jgi:hypothetical protein